MSNRSLSGNTFQDVFQAFVRHKRKSLVFFVTVVVGVALLTFLLPREYRSVGKLFVRLGRENATLDPTATLGQNPIVAVPQSRENEINSVVEILQSRVLLEKVVDGLTPAVILDSDESADSMSKEEPDGWARWAGAQIGQVFSGGMNVLRQFGSSAGLDDRERAILWLGKKLKIEAARKSNVIGIAYEGATPEQCQSVVAKVIDCFLDEHLRLNRTHGSEEFLAEQTSRLHEGLTQKEAELRDLKNETGLASPSVQRQLLVTRIGRLEDDLLSAQAGQAVAEAKVRTLRDKLNALPETQMTTEITGFANEGTDHMREQFYLLQVREKEAQAKYTEDHPKMQQIRDKMAAARAILDDQERGRKHVTKEPGRLHHQAQVALLGEEPGLASLRMHAEKLRTQLAEVRTELATLNENEMRIVALQREVDLSEAEYRKYSVNLEQARIDHQLEIERISNIGIVQPASYEPRPIRPRTLLNLLLGVCAGVAGALALPLVLEQFDDARQTPVNGERKSKLPTLATVPRLRARQFAAHERRVPR